MGTKPRAELLRILGPWTATAVVIGAVIGSGIFKKPQVVAQNIQNFEVALAAWVLGGVLTLLGAMSVAELGGMIPQAGGNYVYLRRAYGPVWGFLWAWTEFWIQRTASIAALATLFTESLDQIIGAGWTSWEQRGVTASVIMGLAVVNALGVRWGGLVQNVTTVLKVGSLAAISVLPFALGRADPGLLTQPREPLAVNPVLGFGAAMIAILWPYHGWMGLTPIAEEVRNPQRNVPLALIVGVLVIIAVYLGANIAYAVVLPQDVMADKEQVKVVAISFAERLFASWGPAVSALAAACVSAAIMVSVFGALNANILIGPRTYFALGRDGLAPGVFAYVSPRFRTPFAAILLQAGWACALVFGAELLAEPGRGESPFDILTDFALFGAIIFETMVVTTIFRFRRLYPDLPRPYRCWGYPFVPAFYTAVLALLLTSTILDKTWRSLIGLGLIGLGAVYFGLYYALVWHRRGGVPGESLPPGAMPDEPLGTQSV
jgi:amino acid transporter